MSLVGMALVMAACASSPRPRPEADARIKDSVPERVAAQRASARDLQLEDNDQRWGIEAASERRRQKEQRNHTQATAPVGPQGPVDLQRPNP